MKALTTGVVTAVLLLLTRAQGHGQPRVNTPKTADPQPSDLHFVLSTKDGRSQFHLGEIIEMEEAYSADSPGKYLLLSLPAKLQGGHSAQIRMWPEEHVINRIRDAGYRNADSILHANCSGGVGGGVAGDCYDCDNVYALKTAPIRFPYVLTAQFQIMEPGHYFVQAEAANAVRAPLDLEGSVPISLTSNTVEIDVVDDPAWSKAELQSSVTRFEKAQSLYVSKGWDAIPMNEMGAEGLGARITLEAEMQRTAETMRVLDTEDSLTQITRFYDGAPHSSDYSYDILYRGIIQSKHQALAVKLLAARFVDPDFSVSQLLLDQLTAMTLEDEFPGSLAADDIESRRRFYPAARRILRSYILALGKSLPEKDEHALGPSLKTFKTFAREDFCSGRPLIPEVTFQRMVRSVQAFDLEPEP